MTADQDESGASTRVGFRGTRAVLVAVALALAAVLALAGCATGAQHVTGAQDRAEHGTPAALTSTHAPVTARHTFDPYTKSGKLTVAVVGRTNGSCFSTSLADPTSSAFRCFAGNQLLDPCFARPGTGKGATVACIADPWSKATVLKLTKALPGKTFALHRVWAFVRSDGVRCVAATGTVPAVAGRSLDYNCSDHSAAALTGARTQRVGAVFARSGATTLRSAAVREIWHS